MPQWLTLIYIREAPAKTFRPEVYVSNLRLRGFPQSFQLLGQYLNTDLIVPHAFKLFFFQFDPTTYVVQPQSVNTLKLIKAKYC